MKKNVIVFLIDSLTTDCIGKNRTEESSTPFLDTLLSHSIFAPNAYSYGPYTDAATKGLWCSMPTLSDYGYYFSINGSEINHYKVFKENGYETYGFYYPYYMMSPKLVQNIDHSVFTSSYAFYANWRNFGFYADEMKKRSLSEREIQLMIKSLDLIFMGWMQYYSILEHDENASVIICDIASDKEHMMDSIKKAHQILTREYGEFRANPNDYLYNFLQTGMNHVLASIDPFNIDLHVDRDFLRNSVYSKESAFLRYAQNKNFKYNLKNNPIYPKKVLKGIMDTIHTHDPYDLKYPVNYWLGLNSVRNVVKKSLQPKWQYQPSARRLIETGMDLLSKRENTSPFYAIFHVEEPHSPISFFSYDIHDMSKISEEFDYLRPLVNNCGTDFKGSLGYQMAVRYDDYCLKIIFDKMKQMDILKDTVVLVTADHGSSYTYYPVRKRTVNCFHKENYNIPMVIWDNDINKQIYIEKKCTSADIYPTLYDYLKLTLNQPTQGKSLLKEPFGRDYVITEYMGPGCPDMLTRDVWISIRNERWMIAYKISISDTFRYKDPYQIFNLVDDPYELNNLARTIDITKGEVKLLIDKLKERFEDIKIDRDKFIKKLENGRISFESNS